MDFQSWDDSKNFYESQVLEDESMGRIDGTKKRSKYFLSPISLKLGDYRFFGAGNPNLAIIFSYLHFKPV